MITQEKERVIIMSTGTMTRLNKTTAASNWDSVTSEEKLDYQEVKDFVTTHWEDNGYSVEKTSLQGNIAYSIVHSEGSNNMPEEQFIGITIVDQNKNEKATGRKLEEGEEDEIDNSYTINYRTLTEHDNPEYVECPITYIKRLNGIHGATSAKATTWRKRVIETNEKNKALDMIKDSGDPVEVQYGHKTFSVMYDKGYRRWMVQGKKNTYIPSKYVRPDTVNLPR